MKRGIEGERVLTASLVIIILVTIGISIFTVFSSNNSLRNNETKNMSNNGENITPSSKSSYTPSKDEVDKLNVDTTPTKEIEEKVVPKKEPEQIATYTTTIYDTDTNRVDNITLTNSKLNGTIIKVGEEFSFNNTIGPMDESQGYKKALGFDSNGNKIQISGGGICQISSTLYNCALIANLEVTERHPHSHRVYYVPQDKDATIFYGSLDLKFKNNTDRDIKIESSNDNANVTINLVKI